MARGLAEGAEARRIEGLRRRIERWRGGRKRRSPMPTGLWAEASALARDLGVHRVKTALGLNYESLKRRVGEAPTGESASGSSGAFVELSGAQLLGPASAPVVEVSDGDGSHLRVQLGTGRDLDVVGLVEAFVRRRRA
jgi:hypothetical protein